MQKIIVSYLIINNIMIKYETHIHWFCNYLFLYKLVSWLTSWKEEVKQLFTSSESKKTLQN